MTTLTSMPSTAPLIRRKAVPYTAVPQIPQPDSPPEKTASTTSQPLTSSPRNGQPQKELSLFEIWWEETVACAIAASGLTAIVVTLLMVRNKPVPSLPFHVSVNTLIAIFAALLRVPALFVLAEGLSYEKWSWFTKERYLYDFAIYDNASRGPWGAAQLLWRFRRTINGATLAAIATVVALLVDPFSQQLIQNRNCDLLLSSAIASLPRTRLYNQFGGHIAAGANALPNAFIGSMATGQFSTTFPQVSFHCTSGNCTFAGNYSTVGYCSSCIDISDQLMWSFRPNDTVPSYVLSLPLTYDDFPGVSVAPFEGERHKFTMVGGSNITMAWYNGSWSNETTDTIPGYAYQCAFNPCIHTISGTVINGTLREQTLQRGPIFGDTLVPGPPGFTLYSPVVDLACINDTSRHNLHDLGYEFDDSTRWLPYNVCVGTEVNTTTLKYSTWFNMTEIAPYTDAAAASGFYTGSSSNWNLSNKGLEIVPQECIYQNPDALGISLYLYLQSYFTGNVSVYEDDHTEYYGPMVPMSVFLSGATDNNLNGSLEKVQYLMQNITDSMTTYIRMNGDVSMSDPVTGTASYTTICVHVRWGWIALDAAFVVLLLVFFLALLVDAPSKKSMRIYSRHNLKSSALATLFHGLDVSVQERALDVGYFNTLEAIEEIAKDQSVVLQQTRCGMKLSYAK